MFFEPERTQYDLNFRLLGTDVRIHPWFWLMSAFLGWSQIQNGFTFLLVWIVCVFVSILVHEFGHIFMGRVLGSHGHIVLYGMGGLAVGSSEIRSRFGRIAVSFAGPAAGLLLWVAVYLALPFALNENSPPLFEGLLLDLYYINLIWSLLNLLPIWPLDGGRMSREFFEWLLPQKGTSLALGVSFVIAALLAINALSVHFAKHALPVLDQIPYVNRMDLYTALLFGLLAFGSFQMLQFESRRRPWDREDEF